MVLCFNPRRLFRFSRRRFFVCSHDVVMGLLPDSSGESVTRRGAGNNFRRLFLVLVGITHSGDSGDDGARGTTGADLISHGSCNTKASQSIGWSGGGPRS